MTARLHSLIQSELDKIPGRWRIEQGKRHKQILIDERLVAIIPHGHKMKEAPTRDLLNTRAEIRRFLGGRQ